MDGNIVLLLGFTPDPRNLNHINAEKNLGNLHVIFWNRGNGRFSRPDEDGFHVHEIKINAVNDPLKRLIPYQKFTKEVMRLLKEIKPKLIHVQGLDMLSIACTYKKKYYSDLKIVYEVADIHRLIADKQKSLIKKCIRKYLIHKDMKLSKDYDLLVVASEKFYDVYFSKFVERNKWIYMPNAPVLSAFENYKAKDHERDFTVGYIGAIRYKKQIYNLLNVTKELNMHVLMAGYEEGNPEIEAYCQGMDNVEWIGKFDFDTQAAALYGKCDVMYSVYDATMKNVRVALPNKLYEALYCRIPLIVAKNTYLAELSKRWGTGVAVDSESCDELKETLLKLKENKEFYNNIVEHCNEKKDECTLSTYNKKLIDSMEKLLS